MRNSADPTAPAKPDSSFLGSVMEGLMTMKIPTVDELYQIYLTEDLTPKTIFKYINLLKANEIDFPERKDEIQELIAKYEESLELITAGEDIRKGKMHSTSNTTIVHTNPHPPVQALTTNKAVTEGSSR
ncbi:hypothetical protein HNY73_008244 [Argiope bruennichi]|uniref:Uncharacterized protein n=1 Tax=Argiope bruennichi TaxID=94029 RepID=A0A8T0F5R7_ARGBR|nr:hypothetical protein HNY73_008244 [Argiope bruennichi]